MKINFKGKNLISLENLTKLEIEAVLFASYDLK